LDRRREIEGSPGLWSNTDSEKRGHKGTEKGGLIMTKEQLEKGNAITKEINTLEREIHNLNYPDGPAIHVVLQWHTDNSGGSTVPIVISGDTAKKLLDQAMELKRNDLKEATSEFERL